MKKISLSIPEPCHESWDRMTQVEKGKFCASCQKTVMDFTNMSDRQLAEFFKKSEGFVCGHFYRDQLNRDITIPRKRIPWIKYFFQFSLPAFLVSMKTSAQGRVTVSHKATICNRITMGTPVFHVQDLEDTTTKTIQGKVTDLQGNAIVGASVLLKEGSTASTAGTVTDTLGNFRMTAKKSDNCRLQFSAIGYQSSEVVVTDMSVNVTLVPVTLSVVTVGMVVRAPRKEKMKIPLLKRMIDTTFKNFSVYPNPVQNHSSIKIGFKKFEPGNYTVSIINMGGEVVQTEEIVLENKKQAIDLQLSETAAGTYFIHLFNRRTAASWSEKILIQ